MILLPVHRGEWDDRQRTIIIATTLSSCTATPHNHRSVGFTQIRRAVLADHGQAVREAAILKSSRELFGSEISFCGNQTQGMLEAPLFPKELLHLILQVCEAPIVACAGNTDDLPGVLDEFLKAILAREPLVIALAVPRGGGILSKPFNDVWIEVFIDKVHE